MRRSRLMGLGCAIVLLWTTASSAQTAAASGRGAGKPKLSADTQKKLNDSLERGAAYLRQQQHADGTWENHPGITAMAATALLRQPGVARDKQMATAGKTLDALAKLAKPDGGIYDKQIPHYITAVSMMAFVAGGRPQDKP
ncbi:MAG TPA: hypothetical protein VLV86_24610, partial [Vicinamibacterales bacterium]|nr:hypothetical protein [Vicinamibacterales bacterium]